MCRSALCRKDSATLRKNEINFHRTIANVTQNLILILILDFIENLLEDVKRILKPDIEFSRGVVEAHEQVYQTLVARDTDGASSEMLADVLRVEAGLAKLSEKVNIKLN